MSEDRIISGIHPVSGAGIKWINPFTGELEDWHNSDLAVARQLQSAAEVIRELREEIEAIKSFLVI